MIATILPTFATNWVQVGNKYYIDIDTIEPYVDDSGHVAPNQYSYWTKVLNDGSDFYKRQEKKIKGIMIGRNKQKLHY